MTPQQRLLSPAFALTAGMLLSFMRAPLGLDPIGLIAVDGFTAGAFRAGALLAIALVLLASRARVHIGTLLLVGWAGFSVHGFLLESLWQPQSRLGFGLGLLLATALLHWLRRGLPGGLESAETQPGDGAPPRREFIGLTLAGAGLAGGLEILIRHIRLLGLGLSADDALIGSVLCVVLFLGWLAFGRLMGGRAFAPGLLGPGVALAALGVLVGLGFLHTMDPIGLNLYARRFGLDLSMHGTLAYTGLIATAALIVPGLVIGTALEGARHPARLAALCTGAACAALCLPWLVDRGAAPLGPSGLAESTWAGTAAALAAGVAAIGALLATGGGGSRNRAGVALALLAGVVAWIAPRPAVWLFSPWYPAPIEPVLATWTSAGFLTLESDRDGTPQITLDRRRLTPTAREEGGDAERLAAAFSLLDRRAGADVPETGPRVLLVGPMTPARVRALIPLGPMRLDHTVPYHAVRAAIDGILFPAPRPFPGKAVSPGEARQNMSHGEYDLVVIPPTYGPVLVPKAASRIPWGGAPVPVTGGLNAATHGTSSLVVAWLDARSPLQHLDLGQRVLAHCDGLTDLTVGVLPNGAPAPPPDGSAGSALPWTLLPSGAAGRRPSGLALLMQRSRFRADPARASLAARLQAASAGTGTASIGEGIGVHFGAQRSSSPFEDEAQRIELKEAAVAAFFQAANSSEGRSTELDPFLHNIWEDLARLLVEKRQPDLVLAYVEPLADAHRPWKTMEQAVARAYAELLMPASAADIGKRLARAHPLDLDLLFEAAAWCQQAGDRAGEAQLLELILTLQPDREDVAEHLARVRSTQGPEAGPAPPPVPPKRP